MRFMASDYYATGLMTGRGVPNYDPATHKHLWVAVTMYEVNPARAVDPDQPTYLDSENLLTVAGPACFYCEEGYTPRRAASRCPGQPRE